MVANVPREQSTMNNNKKKTKVMPFLKLKVVFISKQNVCRASIYKFHELPGKLEGIKHCLN